MNRLFGCLAATLVLITACNKADKDQPIEEFTSALQTKYADIGSTDYTHILFYSQSLGMGWEAQMAITQEAVPNTFMYGNNVLAQYNTGKGLNPLRATLWEKGGEQPIVACVNSFSTLWNNSHDKPSSFIATSAGEGGKSIELLSKSCTNGTNYYTSSFLKSLRKVDTAVMMQQKTVSCPAIVYMQGENNYNGFQLGLVPGTEGTSDKATYKAFLLRLKSNMQADVMAIYKQPKKPVFFIYQTCGNFINRVDMSITMAQVEFSQENADVVLLNPTYFTPDYGGGHLSANGYRWYGESIAKTLADYFISGKKTKPVSAKNVSVIKKQVVIDHYVPAPPLVFDTWTTWGIPNYGYRVLKNGVDVNITNKEISGDKVILTCDSVLSGTIEITYAGYGSYGAGNLRDNDQAKSMYNYYNNASDTLKEDYTPTDSLGEKMYGKPYPLYNWCVPFYKKIVL